MSRALLVSSLLFCFNVWPSTLVCEGYLSNTADSGTDLNFEIIDGVIHNRFFRKDDVAAHISTNSGVRPAVVVGFPAGNTGVYAEFAPQENLSFEIEDSVTKAVKDFRRLGMTGIKAKIKTSRYTDKLKIEKFVLGNVRFIREWEGKEKMKPSEIQETVVLADGRTLRVSRELSPGHRYELTIRTAHPSQIFEKQSDSTWAIVQNSSSRLPIEFTIVAETSEKPLTPIPLKNLLKPEVLKAMDPAAVRRLQFLSYKEKFLAGSWRYLNFFFRDTALSVRLMFDALQPEAVEAALVSIFERMNSKGEFAHEEALSDFAFYLNQREGRSSDAPVYDYKMIDNDFMLAPIALKFLSSIPADRANRLLNRTLENGTTIRQALNVNLFHVIQSARLFAQNPNATNLIHLKKNETTGQWRDSEQTFMSEAGAIPYDVNVALVPAALNSAATFLGSDRFGMRHPKAGDLAARYYGVWKAKAAKFFEVEVDAAEARVMAERFARKLGLRISPVEISGPIRFSAIGLRKNGEPIRVMHSDEAALLLFETPSEEQLDTIADRVLNPFPYGLMSPIGIFIANSAFASPATQSFYSPDHYHGLLVWGREQAMFAVGLEEQLKRTDLSPGIRQKLIAAEAAVWNTISRTIPFQNSELWTWKADAQGKMSHVPYGQSASHHTSANPVQLWSEAGAVIRALHESQFNRAQSRPSEVSER